MSDLPVVVATSALHPRVEQDLAGSARVRTVEGAGSDALWAATRDAHVLIVRDTLPPGLLTASPQLRAAIRHGAGVDMIPVHEATQAAQLVAVVPGANAQSVAEHAIMAMLALSRRLPQTQAALCTREWGAARVLARSGGELTGRTLGLVGTGNVGRAVAAIARHGLGMRVLGTGSGHRPVPEDIEARTLDRLLAESDVVVLACPLTPRTHHLIDASALALLRPHALLVNVARGAVIDDDALLEALRHGRIAGAALDVFAEQPLPADHPYFAAPNVLVTPHTAGITEDSLLRMGFGAAARARAVLAGDLPLDLVNPEVVPRYRQRWSAPVGVPDPGPA